MGGAIQSLFVDVLARIVSLFNRMMYFFLISATQIGGFIASVSGGESREQQLSRERFEKDVGALFEGDIILPRSTNVGDGERKKRQAFRGKNYPDNTWKDGVYYQFDPQASGTLRNEFHKAAKAWSQDTCIKFIEQDSTVDEGLFVTPYYDVCASEIGRNRKWQGLFLGKNCESFATVAHELGHTLGLAHTMARHNREKHIWIDTINMNSFYAEQFKKNGSLKTYGVGYDYGSIMHYRQRSASSDYVIIIPDSKYKNTLGSAMISFADLTMINRHYNCTENCTSVKAVECKNGGYPHPRNCSRCLCPGGYGGIDCNERPSGECGQELQANKTWQNLTIEIHNNNPEAYLDGFKKCYYWIKAPNNTRVKIKLEEISFEHSAGCTSHGIEIKVGKDPTLTGYRFCGGEEYTLTSRANVVPIIAYSQVYHPGVAVIRYRYVDQTKRKSSFYDSEQDDHTLASDDLDDE